jgi:hypothetical protein
VIFFKVSDDLREADHSLPIMHFLSLFSRMVKKTRAGLYRMTSEAPSGGHAGSLASTS